MEFQYKSQSRPEIVEAFNATTCVHKYWTLIEYLFENGGIKGAEEHEAALKKLRQFLPLLSSTQCWSIATLSQIKSELCNLAYDSGFKKARS